MKARCVKKSRMLLEFRPSVFTMLFWG